MSTLLTTPADPVEAPAAAAAHDPVPAQTPAAPPADLTPEWMQSLPDDLRGDKTLARYKTPTDAYKALVEQHKALSQRPQEPQIPADPSGYDLKVPEIPGLVADQAALSYFKGVFHKAGVPTEKAQDIVNAYAEYEAERITNARQGWKLGLGELEREWGSPLYARRSTLAARVISRFGGQRAQAWLDESGMGDHPELVRLFGVLGEQFAEDGVISGRTLSEPTQEDIKRQANDLREQIIKLPEGHPDRIALEEKRLALYRLLPGGTDVVATFGR